MNDMLYNYCKENKLLKELKENKKSEFNKYEANLTKNGKFKTKIDKNESSEKKSNKNSNDKLPKKDNSVKENKPSKLDNGKENLN